VNPIAYPGPLRGEPLPIELHNTLWCAPGGTPVDGLADRQGLHGWLSAMAAELPVQPTAVDPDRLEDFHQLRGAVRTALHAALESKQPSAASVQVLNAASAASPHSVSLAEHGGGPRIEVAYQAADPIDVVLGVLASDTIELVAGPDAAKLRACGAPGCVLMFVKDHPRREWCSAACGNRARQARHYARTRGR
jgi:predicted RNA-binding Zn ribbon-like protein